MKRVLSYLVLSFISALSLYFCLLSINFININLIKNHSMKTRKYPFTYRCSAIKLNRVVPTRRQGGSHEKEKT